MELDASKLSNGMYFYQINYNNTSITKRFIVNK
ncbi:MAG: T9SS type A sorting domain-containing protein [Bacteroidetes bacterium]|nr:T9SS type A sorting domain-containing protein [Bacteroidota bacterium]